MIYDCFPFFNELDLLEIRLTLLHDKVDYFVITEANVTYTGIPKPFYYLQHKDRFKPFNHKIKYIPITDMPKFLGSGWPLEYRQRNSLSRGLTEAQDADIIMLSDVDEIPNPAILIPDFKQMATFTQIRNCFYANRMKGIWGGTVIGKYKIMKQGPFQTWRNVRGRLPGIPNGGWHFSWLGGVDAIITKLQSFAHIEENTPYNTDKQRIEACLKGDIDMFKQGDIQPYTDYPDIFNTPKYSKYLKETV